MKAKLMKAYLPSCIELVRLILRKDLEELCQSTKRRGEHWSKRLR